MTASGWPDDPADEDLADDEVTALADLLPYRCWACRGGLPHQHDVGECAHWFADGDRRTCCSDFDADRTRLLMLIHRIRSGAAAVPDDLAGLDAGPEPLEGQ